MQAWVLGSGSRGNAILLDAGETRILIDAGFAPRTLAMRMRACRIAPESIRAVVITHEHVDHVRGARAAAARWGWEVHASAGTAGACLSLRAAHRFRTGDVIRIGSVAIQSVPIAHDAADPVALVACHERTGARIAIAHDLGRPSGALRRALDRVDVLVLESNHDEGMLRTGPYPPFLQRRISGGRGHLSNRDAATIARTAVHGGMGDLVLAHLSEENNTPQLAHESMTAALRGSRFRGRLTPAPQGKPCGPFGPPAPVPRARQLTLGF